jgi:hypothetical protein
MWTKLARYCVHRLLGVTGRRARPVQWERLPRLCKQDGLSFASVEKDARGQVRISRISRTVERARLEGSLYSSRTQAPMAIVQHRLHR